MRAASRSATNQLELDFVDSLPPKPYCTNDKAAGLLIRPRTTARLMRYIQPNGPYLKAWLPLDIDRDRSVLMWEEANVPAPNFITATPGTHRCHYLYGLKIPLQTGPRGSPGPLRYAAAIHRALSKALGADPGYSGLITKNPLHPYWYRMRPRQSLYGLDDLAGWLDLESVRSIRPKEDVSFLGRNCSLFDSLRFWAYEHVRDYRADRHQGAWFEAVLSRAHDLNRLFQSPLPASEIQATARSVSKWTWVRYDGRGRGIRRIQRGIMGLDHSGLPLAERQSLAAERTNHLRLEATTAKIVEARAQLLETLPTVSTAELARKASVHRVTAHKRRLLASEANRIAERRARVGEMAAANAPTASIAAILGVSPWTVAQDLRALGLARQKGRPKKVKP
jgi:hypothetical protein